MIDDATRVLVGLILELMDGDAVHREMAELLCRFLPKPPAAGDGRTRAAGGGATMRHV